MNNHLSEQIIREKECARLTGLSRSTRWRLERLGQFPCRIHLSAGCTGWALSEVEDWLRQRMADRRRTVR
jgi:prophage regulatory protein